MEEKKMKKEEELLLLIIFLGLIMYFSKKKVPAIVEKPVEIPEEIKPAEIPTAVQPPTTAVPPSTTTTTTTTEVSQQPPSVVLPKEERPPVVVPAATIPISKLTPPIFKTTKYSGIGILREDETGEIIFRQYPEWVKKDFKITGNLTEEIRQKVRFERDFNKRLIEAWVSGTIKDGELEVEIWRVMGYKQIRDMPIIPPKPPTTEIILQKFIYKRGQKGFAEYTKIAKLTNVEIVSATRITEDEIEIIVKGKPQNVKQFDFIASQRFPIYWIPEIPIRPGLKKLNNGRGKNGNKVYSITGRNNIYFRK